MNGRASYYRLKSEWVLRGWENLPRTLVSTETGQLLALDDVAFFAASSCDGKTDFELPLFLDIHRAARDRLLAAGIVEELRTPAPLSDHQHYRRAENPFYRTLHWSITGSCNLKCRHCYLCAPDRKYEDLSFERIRALVGEVTEAGIMEVSITGGEPFVREEIWDILALLVAAGIRITQIYTNGVLVTDSVLERLSRVLGAQSPGNGRKTEFSLSFDGVGTHDDLRGIEGTEKKTVKAIERIRAHGFPVAVETVLYRKNAAVMTDTLRLLSSLGISSWKISGVGDTGKWLETGGKENLTVPEIYDCYMDLVASFLREGRPLNAIQVGGLYFYNKGSGREGSLYAGHPAKGTDDRFLKRYSCNACRFIRYLLSDGTLLPCISMTGTEIHRNMPNIREKSLVEALKDPGLWEIVSIRVGDLAERNEECSACEHLGPCGMGCRSCALTYGGGVFSRDPFTCHYWKHGYAEKVSDLIGAR